MKLKAIRYLEPLADGRILVSPGMVEFVERIRYMSFSSAIKVYDAFATGLSTADKAFLAANDRFFLLTAVLGRTDAINEWVYDRCREVEEDPDGHIDLWARYHYKSTIITFAGVIQEIINDPEITVGIFSNKKEIALPFLRQIKQELETNGALPELYPDVFWSNPKKEAPLWSESEGIIVRRQGNPKEATVEAHGIISGMPTGRHFKLRLYDDLVTEKSVTQTDSDQIGRTTYQWELSQNLGSHDSDRMQATGTRYHFADTHGVILDRGTLKKRLYPATHDGTLNGDPVFLGKDKWDKVKRDQRSTVAAQMLLNPLAGSENTFLLDWLRPYRLRPSVLNIYILCDPSKGKTRTSDRTAIIVLGVDAAMNLYLLDGYCHRMKLTERWNHLRDLFIKWRDAAGIYNVSIGYERYGMQTDLEHFEERMWIEKIEGMAIDEVAWAREGSQSKKDRIARLEPDFRESRFWMPPYVWLPRIGKCTWEVKAQMEPMRDQGMTVMDKVTGEPVMVEVEGGAEIVYTPYRAATGIEKEALRNGERFRIMEPIRRLDEDRNVYDLTRAFIEELKLHPFGAHEDALDAASRIKDMSPVAPVKYESIADSREPVTPD